MLEVKIKKVEENCKLPKIATKGDACFDVFASKIEEKEDGLVIVYLGFKTEIPDGWRADIRPRSSLTKTGWVIPNAPGAVDSGFRNQWQVRFRPIPQLVDVMITDVMSNREFIIPRFPYQVGDAVAQICFEKVNPVNFVESEEFSESERGEGGFGSTTGKI